MAGASNLCFDKNWTEVLLKAEGQSGDVGKGRDVIFGAGLRNETRRLGAEEVVCTHQYSVDAVLYPPMNEWNY